MGFSGGRGKRFSLRQRKNRSRFHVLRRGSGANTRVRSDLVQTMRRRPGVAIVRGRFTVRVLARRRLKMAIAHRAPSVGYCKTCVLSPGAKGISACLTGIALVTANKMKTICRAAAGPLMTANSNVTVMCQTGKAMGSVRFMRFRPATLCRPNSHPSFLVARTVEKCNNMLHAVSKGRFVRGCSPHLSLTPHSVMTHTVSGRVGGHKSSRICLSMARGSPRRAGGRFPGVCRGYLDLKVSVAERCVPMTPSTRCLYKNVGISLGNRSSVRQLCTTNRYSYANLRNNGQLTSGSLVRTIICTSTTTERYLSIVSRCACGRRVPR